MSLAKLSIQVRSCGFDAIIIVTLSLVKVHAGLQIESKKYKINDVAINTKKLYFRHAIGQRPTVLTPIRG